MQRRQTTSRTVIKGTLWLWVIFGSCALALAQGQGQRPAFDPLRGLKQALTEAGAPALTSSQEEHLTTLITNFRNSHQPAGPSAEIQAAQKAYDDAILAGDLAGAQAAAATLSNLIAAETRTRLSAAAGLEIAALAVLKNEDPTGTQVSKLTARFGATGLTRILGSLAGGFGGPRGFGGGFGGPRGFGGGTEGPAGDRPGHPGATRNN